MGGAPSGAPFSRTVTVLIPSTVGFCLIDSRAVFLDIRADRYWLVPPPASSALRALIAREHLTAADDAALAGLVRLGLLETRDGDERPQPCVSQHPQTSLLDDAACAQPITVLTAWQDTMMTTRTLRRRGLAQAIASLMKARTSHGGERRATVSNDVAAGFAALRLWLSPTGRCLPLSLALATRCADRETKLVIGVKLGPFAAHAWVQRRNQVLNDHVDAVRPFTPIFVA